MGQTPMANDWRLSSVPNTLSLGMTKTSEKPELGVLARG
jgi:hypothetical protein